MLEDLKPTKFVRSTKQSTLPPLPPSRFFCHPDSGWSCDQPQPGSFFQRPREAEKRDPGNEVGGPDKATACLFIGIVCRLLKVIFTVLPILQTRTKAEVFASVRNSHRTLLLAVAKHTFLSKCRFAIFMNTIIRSIFTLFTSCKHRHQYYIGIIHIFER